MFLKFKNFYDQTSFPFKDFLTSTLSFCVSKINVKYIPPEPETEQIVKIINFLMKKNFIKFFDFIDIGSNRGRFSEYIYLYFNNKFKYFLYEPLQHYKVSNPNFNLRNYILSDKSGKTKIYYNSIKFFNIKLNGYESIYKENVSRYGNLFYKLNYSICKQAYLDQFNHKPFFIKIDAEGAEEVIIRGATKTINKFLPIIFYEYNLNLKKYPNFEIIHNILGKNYCLYIFRNKNFFKINNKIVNEINSSNLNIFCFPNKIEKLLKNNKII